MDNKEYYIKFKGTDSHNDRTNYLNWNYDDATYFMASRTDNYFLKLNSQKNK